MKNLTRVTIGLVIGILVSASGSVRANAQSVEEFYRGKAITLLISVAAGGSTDFLGRQFAEYFAKHIPGQPDVIVQNQPGAGGMLAASQLQHRTTNDGTVVGFLQRNNLFRSLVDETHDQFDPREVDWIGSLNKERYVLVTTKGAPVQTADEIFEIPLIVGATGFANENRTLTAMMNEYLGAKFKIISGYPGSEDVNLAMERGEVDGKAVTVVNLLAGNDAMRLREGELNVLLHLGMTTDPHFPDIPNLSDYVQDESVISLINFLTLPFEAGRPLAVPRGVPEDRLAALRDAFDAAASDPEFIAHMEELNATVDPISGLEVEAIRDELYETPEDVVEMVRKIFTSE